MNVMSYGAFGFSGRVPCRRRPSGPGRRCRSRSLWPVSCTGSACRRTDRSGQLSNHFGTSSSSESGSRPFATRNRSTAIPARAARRRANASILLHKRTQLPGRNTSRCLQDLGTCLIFFSSAAGRSRMSFIVPDRDAHDLRHELQEHEVVPRFHASEPVEYLESGVHALAAGDQTPSSCQFPLRNISSPVQRSPAIARRNGSGVSSAANPRGEVRQLLVGQRVRERTRSSVARETASTAIRTSWDVSRGSFRKARAAAEGIRNRHRRFIRLPPRPSSAPGVRAAAPLDEVASDGSAFHSPERSPHRNDNLLSQPPCGEVPVPARWQPSMPRCRPCISFGSGSPRGGSFPFRRPAAYPPRGVVSRRISQRPERKRQPHSRPEERDNSRSIPGASPGIPPCGSHPARH